MIKIFQGDLQSVQSDIDGWIEVYKPKILDIRQSVVWVEKEHCLLMVLTFLYERSAEDHKVAYRINERHIQSHPAER